MSIDFNKDINKDKFQRSQPVPSRELDRRLLERAEKLNEGKKTFGNETAGFKSVIMTRKEQNDMDNNTVNEIRSRRPAVIISAAAALALVVGGATAALRYTGDDIETTPASQTETSAADFDVSDADTVTANALPKEWAEKYIAQNDQTFGYITIPGLEYVDGKRTIDFPVAIADDNSYYQTHAFDKSESPAGCIFAKAGTEIGADGSQPQIIELFGGETYNKFNFSGNGSKWLVKLDEEADINAPNFTSLHSYTTLDAIKQAPIIEFNTIWQEDEKYAVFGVTLVEGDALGIGEVDDVGQWVQNIRDMSDFDVDIDCGADDKYLVLDICHDGRSIFRVFAKKLDASDDIEAIKSSYRFKDGLDEYGNPEENNYVDIELPVPKGINDMFIVAVYNGDEELSKDTFDDEGRIVLEDVYKPNEMINISYCLSVSGKGKQKYTVALIDPLSSDSTRNRVKYAVYDVDFDANTYSLDGRLNEDGVKELFGKYNKDTKEVYVDLQVPDGIKDMAFDIYNGSRYFDTLYVGTKGIFDPQTRFIVRGIGEEKVTLYARKTDTKNGFDYASFDVNYDTGKFAYADNGKEKQEALKDYSDGNIRPVFIEMPVLNGYDKNVTFEAYNEDGIMGSVYYTKDSERPFGMTLVGEGTEKISITAIFDDKTVKDYMVMNVDFDGGTYYFTKDGQPETGLFDQLIDE